MTKIIRFLGEVIIILGDIFKITSNVLKFTLFVGITIGMLMITLLATFEALHFIQPLDEIGSAYGAQQLDIFGKDLWAWVVAVLGWTTMLYGFNKMFAAEKAENKKMDELRKSDTWLG